MKHFLAALILFGTIYTVSAQADDYNGTWQTTFGDVRVQERSGSFCGEYGETGFVAGYTNGTFARGVFVHADQNTGKLKEKTYNRGLFQWFQSKDGEFNGIWRWGTDVKFSKSEPWNGTRKSKARPSGSNWGRYNGFCLSYLTNVPSDAISWMRAVHGIAPKPASPLESSSSNTSSNSNTTSTKPVPSHVNVGSMDRVKECHISRNNDNLLVCSNDSWRRVIDLSLCSKGTASMQQLTKGGLLVLACHAQVSGSFIQSCDPMMIVGTKSSAHPSQADLKYSTKCRGPKLNVVGSGNGSKTLVNSNARYVRYDRLGGERRYINEYATSACRSASFWNENGYLRCSN